MRLTTSAALAALSLLALGACGARSALDGLAPPGSGMDAGVRLDAGPARDAGRPPDGARPDAQPCPPCDDRVFCNGFEQCVEGGGCAIGPLPDCDDLDECTIDSCDAIADTCRHVRTERDEDGDGVSACDGDCDDRDPLRSPRALEICDYDDEDCDGSVDEGTRSECDDCRPGCHLVPVPGSTGWDPDETAGVEIDPSGDLVLSTTRTETYDAWVANYIDATVTRLDTRDGTQRAAYDSVLLDGRNHAAPPGQECETSRAGGNCPSRTAVDLRGNVYVANRAFFGQATVTKIAGAESDCIDRNRDGDIDTSRDVDGDGIIERTVPGEFLGQGDECILWTVDVGGVGGTARAIAIDAAGTVWVGLWGERAALQLDPDDGSLLRRVELPRSTVLEYFRPYGAAADSRGNVWFVEVGTGRIIDVDTTTGRVGEMVQAIGREGCSSSYGIAIDADDTVWIAGFLCTAAFGYHPDSRTWTTVNLPDSGVTRGIAAASDGRVLVASSHEWLRFGPRGMIEASPPISRLTIFDGRTGRGVRIIGTEASPLPGAATTGVGLDSAGMVWLVNQESSTATRVDPVTGAAREFETGTAPYTYSDFTGYALRTFTAPNGYARSIAMGCDVGPTEWELASWDLDLPPGTRVELRARTAASLDALRTATWVGPFATTPTELTAPPGPIGDGRFVEVEIQLFSDGGASSPRVGGLTLQYHCPI